MSIDTKFVGIKEFRQNMASLAKQAKATKQRVVVMKRNQPLFTVVPFNEDETLGTLVNEIAEARLDVKEGRTLSHEELIASLE